MADLKHQTTAEDFAKAVLAAVLAEIEDKRTAPEDRHGLQLAHVLVRITANKMGVRYE